MAPRYGYSFLRKWPRDGLCRRLESFLSPPFLPITRIHTPKRKFNVLTSRVLDFVIRRLPPPLLLFFPRLIATAHLQPRRGMRLSSISAICSKPLSSPQFRRAFQEHNNVKASACSIPPPQCSPFPPPPPPPFLRKRDSGIRSWTGDPPPVSLGQVFFFLV